MAGSILPGARPVSGNGACAGSCPHVVFVPVPGAIVFGVCVLLIAACVVWFVVMCVEGRREE